MMNYETEEVEEEEEEDTFYNPCLK